MVNYLRNHSDRMGFRKTRSFGILFTVSREPISLHYNHFRHFPNLSNFSLWKEKKKKKEVKNSTTSATSFLSLLSYVFTPIAFTTRSYFILAREEGKEKETKPSIPHYSLSLSLLLYLLVHRRRIAPHRSIIHFLPHTFPTLLLLFLKILTSGLWPKTRGIYESGPRRRLSTTKWGYGAAEARKRIPRNEHG